MALRNKVMATAGASIMCTVISEVGWITSLGGFGFSYSANKVGFLEGLGSTNSSNPTSDLNFIPYYFTVVVYPVLEILLIGAAIQVLVAPSYKMVQAILMTFIVLFAITAAMITGITLSALVVSTPIKLSAIHSIKYEKALRVVLNQSTIAAMVWGLAIEVAALIFSLFFLIDANIYLRD